MLSRMGNNSCGVQTMWPPAQAADTGHSCQGYSLQLRLGALSGFTFGTHVILLHSFTHSGRLNNISSERFNTEVFDAVLICSVLHSIGPIYLIGSGN